MKPSNCKCNLCKTQCNAPCFGTPEDMMKIIGAGYSDRVMAVKVEGVQILAPLYDKDKKTCTFFNDGLCELHNSGLKPTVGKLSHHSTSLDKFNPKKSIHKFVMEEWKSISENEIKELVGKYIAAK